MFRLGLNRFFKKVFKMELKQLLVIIYFTIVVVVCEQQASYKTKKFNMTHRQNKLDRKSKGLFDWMDAGAIKKPSTNSASSATSFNPANFFRQSRLLTLFTVVQFDNQPCVSSTGDNGTCLTSAECIDRGGVPNGPCANGFGVCCLFMVSCGGQTMENGTYFVNMGYPKMFDGTGSCQLTIIKNNPDVCQIRLDFDQFNIMGPETNNHVCNYDQFIVSGGNPVPSICGMNTGNHMYIDVGLGATNPITLTVVTSGPSYPRQWKIRVTQIPCSTIYRAEFGCLQYYSGVSGMIKSFNYEGAAGLQLSNQDYSICIRMERNFCGIQYTACDDPNSVNNRSRAFTLSGNSNNAVGAQIGSTCNSDWLIIPCASNVGRPVGQTTCIDRICGGTFSAEPVLVPSTVLSTVKPFRLIYHTDNVEAPADFNNRGFCLNYVQQPCTNRVT